MLPHTRSGFGRLLGTLGMASLTSLAAVPEIVVTNDYVLEPGVHSVRLVVRADHVVIEGSGALLVGPGQVGDTNSLASAGTGIFVENVTGVVLKNLSVQGFATGLVLRHVRAASVSDCNFSDNYHNPGHGWGELPPRGGILCEDVQESVFRRCRANRVWDGMHLVDSDDNLVADCDFSYCSNTAAKLWHASRNKFLNNNLSYGIRIDRSAGEVHARDSTGVLIETGSNDNYWFGNDVTHGGDGIFIRPLNRWVSRGNVFVENDTSYANNNCVESWSPGNTFIRNRANHGSYGFWLGGSDQTVLIGNEAAYNGLTNGNHNAPEPGFRHGGIVIVGGSSSHTLVQGNDVHDNNGAGIAFRGDVGSQGRKWKTEHWIVQENHIHGNRFGIWGRWGGGILLAQNTMADNAQGNYITNVEDLVELPRQPLVGARPSVELIGPSVVEAGQSAHFDASATSDPTGRPLQFDWWIDGHAFHGRVLDQVFQSAGYHRVSLTVNNGALAAMGWRDLFVVQPVRMELGTEGQASQWGYDLELNADGKGRMSFADDPDSVVGKSSVRFTPNPYPGAYATALFPKARNAHWDFTGKTEIRFWIKAQNPNLPGFQNAGPVVRLLGPHGQITFKPVKEGNLLNDPPVSEARWLWTQTVIPLAGDAQWDRSTSGDVTQSDIEALSVSVDSWGGDPFTVWLDGLTVD